MRLVITVCLVGSIALVGCREDSASDREQMLQLASALTKLSAAVESSCRYKNPPADLRDEGLVELATRHDPKLLQPFHEYLLKAKCEEAHGVVLLCSKDDRALIEDSGCSGALDIHHWQSELPRACAFALPVRAACKVP